jgi:hypothetical protein
MTPSWTSTTAARIDAAGTDASVATSSWLATPDADSFDWATDDANDAPTFVDGTPSRTDYASRVIITHYSWALYTRRYILTATIWVDLAKRYIASDTTGIVYAKRYIASDTTRIVCA